MKPWKKAMLALVFLASSVPYLLVSLFSGLGDLVYFLLIWAIFYFSRGLHPKVFTVVAVVCGAALAIPASLFLVVSTQHIFFYKGALVLMTQNPGPRLLGMFINIALLVSARYLINSSYVKYASESDDKRP